MSSSSNVGDGSSELRYQYCSCKCGNRAALKIVDSQKPTKGLLYFVCERNVCGFFAWCHPMGRELEQVQTNYFPTSHNRQAYSRESSINNPGRVLHETNSLLHPMHRIEHDIRQMRTFITISLVVAILSLLISIFR